MTTRRHFLAGAAALMASGPAWAQRHINLGIQLYTVRDDLAKDFEGTLKKVAAIGFKRVQSNLTMNGRTALQLRKIYDDLGFTWESIHAGGDALRGPMQQTIDQAKAAGLKNITCSFPLYPTDRAVLMAGAPLDDWKRNADTFNKAGELCKRAGLTFAFHNHNVEFKPLDGAPAYDTLLKLTDPNLVNMEMDVGWVVAGGADPVAYLNKYPNRYTALHIKDLKRDGIPNTNLKMISAIVGTGIVDYTKVLAAARKTRVQNAYLEIEAPYNPSPLEMVKASYDWLKPRM